MCAPLMAHTRAATNGAHQVCSNFPRGAHVFCLSKHLCGTQMKPMYVCHLFYSCWAHVCLPFVGLMWAATNGAHWSLLQFSTLWPCALPLERPTSQVIRKVSPTGEHCGSLILGEPYLRPRESRPYPSYKGQAPKTTHQILEYSQNVSIIAKDNRNTSCSENSHDRI